jgi:hypothetical protein
VNPSPGPFERLGAFIDTHAEQVLEQLQRAFQSGGTALPQMTPEQARNIARGYQQLAQCYADAQMPREAEGARRDAERWEARAASMEARPTP